MKYEWMYELGRLRRRGKIHVFFLSADRLIPLRFERIPRGLRRGIVRYGGRGYTFPRQLLSSQNLSLTDYEGKGSFHPLKYPFPWTFIAYIQEIKAIMRFIPLEILPPSHTTATLTFGASPSRHKWEVVT
jgi:hypothetical protein